jgi:hypothetical protein
MEYSSKKNNLDDSGCRLKAGVTSSAFLMKSLFIGLQFLLTFLSCAGFRSMSNYKLNSRMLSMKVKVPNPGNLARKLKRNIRSVNATNFDVLYTPEYDNFLKNEAKGELYTTILKQLTKKARQLNVKLKSDFGIKPKILLPSIVETAQAAGTFKVYVSLKGSDCFNNQINRHSWLL